MRGPNVCEYCGEKLEGASFAVLGGGRVHDDCLDKIQSVDTACKYAKAFPDMTADFLRYHMSDSFMDEFWTAFRGENKEDIERWAVR